MHSSREQNPSVRLALVIVLMICFFYYVFLPIANAENISPSTLSPIWYKTYGGNQGDWGFGIFVDSGYIYITGKSPSYGGFTNPVFTLKCDRDGNICWCKTWGESEWDNGEDIFVDSGYVYVTGYYGIYNETGKDVFILKYDTSGNLIWNRSWCGNKADEGKAVFVDGEYIYVTGFTNSFESEHSANADLFILKYGKDGNLSWQKVLLKNGDQRAFDLSVCSGYIYAVGYDGNDVLLVKYDTEGRYIWNKTWGGNGYDIGYSIVQANDGGFAVTGMTDSYGAGNTDVFLAKYTSNGTLSWSKTWGGSNAEQSRSITQTVDSGYIVSGSTSSYGVGLNDIILVKFTSNGTIKNCSSPMCQSPSATVTSPSATVTTPSATVTSPSPMSTIIVAP